MTYTKEMREAKAAKTTTITSAEEKKVYTAKGAILPTEPVIHRPAVEQTAKEELRPGWCMFTATTRCYVEGAQLEGGQEITLSPAASYKERHNDHLTLRIGEIHDTLTTEQVKKLETGDPRVGKASKPFTLVKPA
jgi:hypothetical protein